MSRKITHAAVALIMLAGVLLRAVQYGAVISLTTDELLLTLNVIDLGWRDLLFHPLQHHQVAPIGFLFLLKVSVVLGGDHELALRFFPFLFSLVSLPLFWRVSIRYLETPAELAALIVFAASPALVYMGSITKQYSGDVMVTLALIWMTLSYFETPPTRRRSIVFGIVGFLGLLISHPAVMVGAGLGAMIFIQARKMDRPLWQPTVICAGWFSAGLIAIWASLASLSPETRSYMLTYWQFGFAPRPWAGVTELLWAPKHLLGSLIFFVAFVEIPRSLPVKSLGAAYTVLVLLGLWHLSKRHPVKSLALLIPVAFAVVATYVRLLPLLWRISLYLGPSLLIISFAGFDQVRSWLSRRMRFMASVAVLCFAVVTTPGLLLLNPPPIALSKARVVLKAMKQHLQAGDQLVTIPDPYARNSALYYGRRMGLSGWSHIYRDPHLTAPQLLTAYLPQIDEFRGEPRVWFFMDLIHTCEEELILGYLNAIGRQDHRIRSLLSETVTVSAYLYDLSDPNLLVRASADTYDKLPACATGGGA